MRRLRDYSIRSKLMLLILVVSSFALTVDQVISLDRNRRGLRAELVSNVEVQARLIGDYCVAPLAFDDPRGAAEILRKAEAIPHIRDIVLHDTAGERFAEYHRGETVEIGQPGFADGHYVGRFDIVFQDRSYGSLSLRASTDAIRAMMLDRLRSGLAVLVALIGVSALLAFLLQRPISRPIQHIADATRRVSEEDNLDIRIDATGSDEISDLSRGFNEMLGRLERQRRKQQTAEKALADSYRFLQSVLDGLPSPAFYKDIRGVYLGCNRMMSEFYGCSRADIVGRTVADFMPFEKAQRHMKADAALLAEGGVEQYELSMARADGSSRTLMVHKAVFEDMNGLPGGIVGVMTDISARVAAEEEKAHLEDQLRQSQKLEAIGRLAGGIAHDFNNVLMVISSYGDLIRNELSADDPMRRDLDEIRHAASRAAELTHQMLAFSRKQVIEPVVFDLNRTLAKSEKMLRRLIGEDIMLEFKPGRDLPNIWFDPGQIDQILFNLAVNSRDAMDHGGLLTVESRREDLGVEKRKTLGLPADGSFVRLTVRDTGHGMDPDTLENIFEPFYTTKGVGKGTGLGMAMVYGIVSQHSNAVEIRSEMDRGTTVNVYLPVSSKDAVVPGSIESDTLPRGTETILLVEDEDSVRKVTARMLSAQGYVVVPAENSRDAQTVFRDIGGQVDLLITDVVMPERSGKECYEALHMIQPDLPVLYMSGYMDDVIARHGVLDEGTHFIQKPFQIAALARKVREVLDEAEIPKP